ncbi:MAG: hypothetical protein RL113_1228, partial [Pseudomonadota bacterium]
DKLRALSSRLEDKLEQKGQLSLFDAVIEAEAPDVVENAAAKIEANIETIIQASSPDKISEKKVSPKIADENQLRTHNMDRFKMLYDKFRIADKLSHFEDVFGYKAMNLTGIGLKEDDFGGVREGKYIQVIAITYEPDISGKKRAKNISLGYFGKGETLDQALKNEIIEFVLRWRYEKAFQNVDHYKGLISRIQMQEERLF